MSTVIKVENISKSYVIGHQLDRRYQTLRDTITQNVKNIGKRLIHPFLSSSSQPLLGMSGTEEFWALHNISFNVNLGEVIGIIGRNGAGKSTLLKILSRITEPTEGRVYMKGRIASLLEVGTGFHPELTGRENIFLNGAILGMTKNEIKKKFDEIVDFSEIEKFLDTPVKRYSSGMYIRLAFAVAAHLETDILVVDEVLAVGDLSFQKKCLGKMGEVAKGGRTVLFVSHNIAAIETLCEKIILLNNGEIVYSGNVLEGIDRYLKSGTFLKGYADLEHHTDDRWGAQSFSRILSIETLDENRQRSSLLKMGKKYFVKVEFEITKLVKDIELVFYFTNHRDILYGVFSSRIEGYAGFKLGRQGIIVEVSELNLMPGNYFIGVWINNKKQAQDDIIKKTLKIEVIQDMNLTGHAVDYTRYKHYGILSRSSWQSA